MPQLELKIPTEEAVADLRLRSEKRILDELLQDPKMKSQAAEVLKRCGLEASRRYHRRRAE